MIKNCFISQVSHFNTPIFSSKFSDCCINTANIESIVEEIDYDVTIIHFVINLTMLFNSLSSMHLEYMPNFYSSTIKSHQPNVDSLNGFKTIDETTNNSFSIFLTAYP